MSVYQCSAFSEPQSEIRIPQFFCPPIFILTFRSRSGYQIVKNKGLAIVPRLFQAILSPSPSELFESNGPVCCIQSSDHMKHREAGLPWSSCGAALQTPINGR